MTRCVENCKPFIALGVYMKRQIIQTCLMQMCRHDCLRSRWVNLGDLHQPNGAIGLYPKNASIKCGFLYQNCLSMILCASVCFCLPHQVCILIKECFGANYIILSHYIYIPPFLQEALVADAGRGSSMLRVVVRAAIGISFALDRLA